MIWITQDFVNATEHCRTGSAEPYETSYEEPGKLFRAMQKEFGRCMGYVYIDKDGKTHKIGWVFWKRQKYEDCNETFLQETWITLYDKDGKRCPL